MSILFPSRQVPISHGREIKVSKLSALNALKVSRLLLRSVDALKKLPLYHNKETGEWILQRSALVTMIPDLGGSLLEFAESIVLASTGKQQDFLGEVDIEDFIDILFAAIELNLTEELQKKVVPLVKKLEPVETQTASETSTESSQPSSSS